MRIASFDISKPEATLQYLSISALHATRRDPNGPLHRIVEWFKGENGRDFDMKKLKLGKSKDDFVALYYMNGVRYKIGKDGRAFVSGADADDMFEREERELQAFIDTLLIDELLKATRKSLAGAGIYVAKTKYPGEIGDVHTRSVTGIKGD